MARANRSDLRLDAPKGLRTNTLLGRGSGRPSSDRFGRFTESIARGIGTPWFLFGMTVFIVGWIVWNTLAPDSLRFDSAALGFIADLGAIQQWGLVTSKRHVVVDSAMRTNLARVFAAGDITDYPGKVRLIAVGFGEAATAVNNAAVTIDPTAHVFPGHSSEG